MFLGCFWDVSRMFLTKEPHTKLQVLTPGNAAKPMNMPLPRPDFNMDGGENKEAQSGHFGIARVRPAATYPAQKNVRFRAIGPPYFRRQPDTHTHSLLHSKATRCREASGKVEGCSSHEFGDIPRDGKNIPRDGKHIPRDGMNTLECGGNVCAAFVDRLSNVEMWREQGPYGSSMQGSCGQEAPKAQPKALDSPGPGTLASSPFKGLSSTWVALGHLGSTRVALG